MRFLSSFFSSEKVLIVAAAAVEVVKSIDEWKFDKNEHFLFAAKKVILLSKGSFKKFMTF